MTPVRLFNGPGIATPIPAIWSSVIRDYSNELSFSLITYNNLVFYSIEGLSLKKFLFLWRWWKNVAYALVIFLFPIKFKKYCNVFSKESFKYLKITQK